MKKIYLSFLIFIMPFFLQSQDFIFHVEPPNWWVDMNSSDLELMVHGENISEYDVTIDDERVNLKHVRTAENNGYLFLDLEILNNSKAFDFEIIFSKEGKTYEKYNYKLLEKNMERNESNYINSSDVIYLINPDRFSNGNQENDFNKSMNEKNINRRKPKNRHGGDLQGIINHLDYINNMGFTSISISSILENDISQNSFKSEAVTDFYKVDTRLGNDSIYKVLSLLASQKGIKLVKDIVLNHIGKNHWWVDDLPFENWINSNINYQISFTDLNSVFDPYSYKKDTDLLTTRWVNDSYPDLNHKNKHLSNYLIQNSIWWIEHAQLSAIKVDYYSNISSSFVEKWKLAIQKEYPGFNVIGESFIKDKSVIGLTQQNSFNKKIKNSASVIMPSLLDFPLQNSIISSFGAKNGINHLYHNLGKDYLYPNPKNMSIFLDNQNTSRCYYLLKHNLNHWKMAQALLLVNRGIPHILYGTEVLMSDTLKPKDEAVVLSDFPGGWDHDKKDVFLNKLSDDEKQAKKFMKTLLQWRKNCNPIHNGNLKHFPPSNNNGLYALIRYDQSRIVLLVMNNSKQKKKINPEYYFKKSGSKLINMKAVNVLTKDEVDINENLFIPPDSFILLDLYF